MYHRVRGMREAVVMGLVTGGPKIGKWRMETIWDLSAVLTLEQ
jgi:hypothetical protein